MKKTLLLILVGLALGYFLGWNDAQTNTEDVVARVVSRVGGKHRDNLKSNADQTLDSLEQH